MSRFGIREGTLADTDSIARAHITSWTDSYRGILRDSVTDALGIGSPAARRRTFGDRNKLVVVAHDLTHGDIVGLCDAGPIRPRRGPRAAGEIYALYLVPHAKRHGLGTELFDYARTWLAARGMTELVIWVLANNPPARRFYEAMGGREASTIASASGGQRIVEVAYYWP